MITVGQYTVIVPDSHEQILLDAMEFGSLMDIENAQDDMHVAEMVADETRIDIRYIIVINNEGGNGHK
ncbi:MAG: hypothetical protein ACYSW6_04895 [Planctomycetota bacterium]|jgi:hypothetical protein